MNTISKRLEEAVSAVSGMSAVQQDLIATEMLELTRALGAEPTRLTEAERIELVTTLAATRSGERVTDEQVASLYARFGL